MPNWCENDLYITGPKKRVQEALELIGATREKPEFDFNSLIPYPKRFKDLDDLAAAAREKDPKDWSVKDGFNQGGYEWCIANWGTKWSSNGFKKVGRHWTFDTAWAPPIPVVKALIRQFQDLNFKLNFFECGCAFKGGLEYVAADRDPDEAVDFAIQEWDAEYKGPRGG